MIQKIPLYIHLIFFFAGMLNFSVPFILETQQHYDDMLMNVQEVIAELEGTKGLTKSEMINIIHAQYDEVSFDVQLVEQDNGIGLEFNGVIVRQGFDENEESVLQVFREFQEHVYQIRLFYLAIDMLKGILYVAFVSLALIMAMQYMSRRAIKFKVAFKYMTFPTLLGSFMVLVSSYATVVSSNRLFMLSFVVTSSLFSLFCLNDLKRAMTGDFLGEGRIDYDIY